MLAQNRAYGQRGSENAARNACPLAEYGGEPFGGGESKGGFVDAVQGLGGFVVAGAVGFALVERAEQGEQQPHQCRQQQRTVADEAAYLARCKRRRTAIEQTSEQAARRAANQAGQCDPQKDMFQYAALKREKYGLLP